MNVIEYGTYRKEIPATWNELTRRQLLFIAARWRKWVDYQKLNADLSKEGIILVKLFLGVFTLNPFSRARRTYYKIIRVHGLIPALRCRFNRVQMHALVKKCDFILSSIALTKNLLPTVKVGLNTYYGPEDGLKNICLHEFAFADSFMLKYTESRNENDLDTAIAVLYRPAIRLTDPEYAGDIRGKFKKHMVDFYQSEISKLPYEQKQAIYLWYRGCRAAIEKRYGRVFSLPDEDDEEDKKKGPDFGWLGIIQELAGDKFGTYDETGYCPAYDIFHYCEKIAYDKIMQKEDKK